MMDNREPEARIMRIEDRNNSRLPIKNGQEWKTLRFYNILK